MGNFSLNAKTLLVIHSYAGASFQTRWSWKRYLIPGWDILGVCAKDSSHQWPSGVRSVDIGNNGYALRNHELVKKLVGTFEYVLRSDFTEYTDFCVIEYDGIFLRKPPVHAGGLCACRSGGNVPGFKASQFLHTPWWCDRETARIVVEEGKIMMREAEWEKGCPDFFLGLVCDRRQIVCKQTQTVSVNGGDYPNHREDIRRAILNGAWYFHGIRTKGELAEVLGLLPNP